MSACAHLLAANMTVYVQSSEMINDAAPADKYEIPGSLAGLDWMEKCIISPGMHRSQAVIDIIASALSIRDRQRQLKTRERLGKKAGRRKRQTQGDRVTWKTWTIRVQFSIMKTYGNEGKKI